MIVDVAAAGIAGPTVIGTTNAATSAKSRGTTSGRRRAMGAPNGGVRRAELADTWERQFPCPHDARPGRAYDRIPMAVHEFPVALDDHPTRTRLLDAAVALLDSVPAERLTAATVLEDAGVSVGSRYHHFASFPDLVAQAVVVRFTRTNAADPVGGHPGPGPDPGSQRRRRHRTAPRPRHLVRDDRGDLLLAAVRLGAVPSAALGGWGPCEAPGR
ncbi:MAG: helix-turn-helix transcriptional regulator [Actinobacteria bacterium]|nr:helix-turn-helix transcriptional regulator [Actinomycetota bacterium]